MILIYLWGGGPEVGADDVNTPLSDGMGTGATTGKDYVRTERTLARGRSDAEPYGT